MRAIIEVLIIGCLIRLHLLFLVVVIFDKLSIHQSYFCYNFQLGAILYSPTVHLDCCSIRLSIDVNECWFLAGLPVLSHAYIMSAVSVISISANCVILMAFLLKDYHIKWERDLLNNISEHVDTEWKRYLDHLSCWIYIAIICTDKICVLFDDHAWPWQKKLHCFIFIILFQRACGRSLAPISSPIVFKLGIGVCHDRVVNPGSYDCKLSTDLSYY